MTGPVAVTGAGGYVGGRLVTHLDEAGWAVRPFARRPVPWSPLPVEEVDLAGAEVDDLAARLDGCDAVVHLAGANEVLAGRDPDRALAETLAAGRRTAAAARRAGVRRAVVLSTTHVYGAAARPGATVRADRTIPEPRHPYALARLALEHLFGAEGPDEVVVLRLTNGVGAPSAPEVDRWSLVGNDLCRQAVEGAMVRLATSGVQWRDFIALTDAVATITAALGDAVPPGTYDLGSGRPMRVLDLAETVVQEADALGLGPVRLEAPAPEGPPPEATTVDTSALAALGCRADTPIADALRETLVACRSARPA